MKNINEKMFLKIFVVVITLALFASSVFSYDARIKWDQNTSQGVTGYNIYRSLVSGNFSADKKIGSVSKDVSEYLDTNLQKGTIYYYAVTTVAEGNIESDYSDQITLSPGDYGDVYISDTGPALSPKDALYILFFYDGSKAPTLQQKYSSDMNHDGNPSGLPSPADALCVLNNFLGKHLAMCPE